MTTVIEGPGNVTDVTGVFTWVNKLVDSFFFPGVLIAVYLIILIKMLSNEANTTSKAFAATSFIVMMLSIFARTMNFVSTGFMSLFIILTAIGGVWMHMENSGGG